MRLCANRNPGQVALLSLRKSSRSAVAGQSGFHRRGAGGEQLSWRGGSSWPVRLPPARGRWGAGIVAEHRFLATTTDPLNYELPTMNRECPNTTTCELRFANCELRATNFRSRSRGSATRMPGMQIILFDIDGTLINSGGAGGAAIHHGFVRPVRCSRSCTCAAEWPDGPGHWQEPVRVAWDSGFDRQLAAITVSVSGAAARLHVALSGAGTTRGLRIAGILGRPRRFRGRIADRKRVRRCTDQARALRSVSLLPFRRFRGRPSRPGQCGQRCVAGRPCSSELGRPHGKRVGDRRYALRRDLWPIDRGSDSGGYHRQSSSCRVESYSPDVLLDDLSDTAKVLQLLDRR